jgi:aminoglycoside phosphotransferase (APT) family kinase protein
MSFVEGTSLEPLFDEQGTDPAEPVEDVAARFHDAAGVLAALHTVDPSLEPPAPLHEEIDRWTRSLETVDSALVPGWEQVAHDLRAAEPEPVPPAILHGDFRLGNTLAVGRRVTAVIDWEIWSVGDPRIDLGWFLISADPHAYRRRTPYVGKLPSSDELARAHWSDTTDLGWFRALACFKSAATWALIVKHGKNPAGAAFLPGLLERAAQLLDD